MLQKWPQINRYDDSSRVSFLTSGNSYFERLTEVIRSATKVIHFQFYIFDPDETGLSVISELEKAIQRGVKVYVVIDAVGSEKLTPEILNDCRRKGINIRLFGPIHILRFRVGRRLHHKVVVVDNKRALVSGINIANKYSGFDQFPWLDFGIELQGPIVKEIESYCLDILNRKLNLIPRKVRVNKNIEPNELLSRVVVNDLVRHRRGIIRSYRSAFRAADNEIIIVASYFLPGYTMRKILRNAAERGVKIKLMVADISDVVIAKRATTYLYSWLLRLGVHIIEYKPSVLHGKLAIVDDCWLTVGSYNLNDLSEFSSIEMNIDVISKNFVGEVKSLLHTIESNDCGIITIDDFKKRNGILSRILNLLSYWIVRASFRLMFFLTKNDRENILM